MFFGNRTRDARAAAAADADTGDAGWGSASGATTPPPRGRRSAVADLGPALAAFHAAGAARAGARAKGVVGAATQAAQMIDNPLKGGGTGADKLASELAELRAAVAALQRLGGGSARLLEHRA